MTPLFTKAGCYQRAAFPSRCVLTASFCLLASMLYASDFQHVSSSAFHGVKYDVGRQILVLKVADGRILSFRDVPASTYEDFLSSPLKGGYFKGHIANRFDLHVGDLLANQPSTATASTPDKTRPVALDAAGSTSSAMKRSGSGRDRPGGHVSSKENHPWGKLSVGAFGFQPDNDIDFDDSITTGFEGQYRFFLAEQVGIAVSVSHIEIDANEEPDFAQADPFTVVGAAHSDLSDLPVSDLPSFLKPKSAISCASVANSEQGIWWPIRI